MVLKTRAFCLFVDKISQKKGVDQILAFMIDGRKQNAKEAEGISLENSAGARVVRTVMLCDEGKASLGIKMAKEALITTDLNQKSFESSTKLLKKYLEIFAQPSIELKENELFGDTDLKDTKESLNAITIEEVKELHKKIISNAQVRVTITIPEKDEH